VPLVVKVTELKPGDRFSCEDPRTTADEFQFIGAVIASCPMRSPSMEASRSALSAGCT
jgi:hypothetical protein